jgi:hypothetical protein
VGTVLTIENHVGRLIEARYVRPILLADFEAARVARRRVIARVGTDRVVVVDARACDVLTQEQSDAVVRQLFHDASSSPPLRHAMLLPPERATFALQAWRMLRDGGSPARRGFQHVGEITLWLDEVLSEPERARLRAFLAETPPG